MTEVRGAVDEYKVCHILYTGGCRHNAVQYITLVVLYRMLTISACYVFDFYVWDAVSIFNHLSRMFLSTDFAFRITDWTCCHGPHLHAILRIISRGVPGLATDSPCGVWGRGWTTCLHFSAHISKWELVCKSGVIFHIFIIISFLGSRFHAWN